VSLLPNAQSSHYPPLTSDGRHAPYFVPTRALKPDNCESTQTGTEACHSSHVGLVPACVSTWRGSPPPPFNKISLARPPLLISNHARHGLLNIEPPSFRIHLYIYQLLWTHPRLVIACSRSHRYPSPSPPSLLPISVFEGLIWLPLPRHCPPFATHPPPSPELPPRSTLLFPRAFPIPSLSLSPLCKVTAFCST
jgi:hypothetical protein